MKVEKVDVLVSRQHFENGKLGSSSQDPLALAILDIPLCKELGFETGNSFIVLVGYYDARIDEFVSGNTVERAASLRFPAKVTEWIEKSENGEITVDNFKPFRFSVDLEIEDDYYFSSDE
jgi:hypothetical protein